MTTREKIAWGIIALLGTVGIGWAVVKVRARKKAKELPTGLAPAPSLPTRPDQPQLPPGPPMEPKPGPAPPPQKGPWYMNELGPTEGAQAFNDGEGWVAISPTELPSLVQGLVKYPSPIWQSRSAPSVYAPEAAHTPMYLIIYEGWTAKPRYKIVYMPATEAW